MYRIQKIASGRIELLRNNEYVADFDNKDELLYCLLDDMGFADELYGNKVIQQLALIKREYPELRLGQLVVNALIEQGKCSYVNAEQTTGVFMANDEDLIAGLRKMYERKLIPFSGVLRT